MPDRAWSRSPPPPARPPTSARRTRVPAARERLHARLACRRRGGDDAASGPRPSPRAASCARVATRTACPRRGRCRRRAISAKCAIVGVGDLRASNVEPLAPSSARRLIEVSLLPRPTSARAAERSERSSASPSRSAIACSARAAASSSFRSAEAASALAWWASPPRRELERAVDPPVDELAVRLAASTSPRAAPSAARARCRAPAGGPPSSIAFSIAAQNGLAVELERVGVADRCQSSACRRGSGSSSSARWSRARPSSIS